MLSVQPSIHQALCIKPSFFPAGPGIEPGTFGSKVRPLARSAALHGLLRSYSSRGPAQKGRPSERQRYDLLKLSAMLAWRASKPESPLHDLFLDMIPNGSTSTAVGRPGEVRKKCTIKTEASVQNCIPWPTFQPKNLNIL